MKNIKIVRCTDEEAKQYQGYVAPEDNSWRLFVDHEGIPHLLLRTNVEMEDGTVQHGMVNIECFMHEDMKIKDLMLSTFGGEPEEGTVDEADFPPEMLDYGPGPHDF